MFMPYQLTWPWDGVSPSLPLLALPPIGVDTDPVLQELGTAFPTSAEI